MPKYFESVAEMLHAEAYATSLLIADKLKNFEGSIYSKEFVKLDNLSKSANCRVYRRWKMIPR
jgi:hypothetical protein